MSNCNLEPPSFQLPSPTVPVGWIPSQPSEPDLGIPGADFAFDPFSPPSPATPVAWLPSLPSEPPLGIAADFGLDPFSPPSPTTPSLWVPSASFPTFLCPLD